MFREKFTGKKLCFLAVLTALDVVLARFISINTMGAKVGFSFVPVMAAAYLFGPFSAGLVGAVSDLLGALLFPFGPYHPGFTVMAFVSGAVFGVFLRKDAPDKKRFWIRAVAAVLIDCLIVGLLINTLWISQLYGSRTYTGWMVYRLTQYAVMIPVELCMAPFVRSLSKRLERIMQ